MSPYYMPPAYDALRRKLSEAEAALRESRGREGRLRALLAELEFGGSCPVDYNDERPCCPRCGGFRAEDFISLADAEKNGWFQGHSADCELAALLEEEK